MIKEEVLKEFISRKMSIREIAEKLDRSYSGVKYWIDKYKLKTIPVYSKRSDFSLCSNCHRIEHSERFSKNFIDKISN
jgi:hypothetical protein